MSPRYLSPKYDQLRDGGSETQSLSGNNEKNESLLQAVTPIKSKLQQFREVALAAMGLLCFWIALITAWRTTLHPNPNPYTRFEKQLLTRGNSTVEAEAQDWVFGLLSHNWLPKPCMDWEVTAEFRKYVRSDRFWGSWSYFKDSKGKE